MKNQIMEETTEHNIPIKTIEINVKNYKKSSISLYEEIAYDFFTKRGFNVIATTYYNRNKERNGLKYHLSPLDPFNKEKIEKQEKIDIRLKNILLEICSKKEWKNFLFKYFSINYPTGFILKGKPDLFIYNDKEFYFVEIKSEYDTLSLEQISWINEANRIGLKTFVLFIKNSSMS